MNSWVSEELFFKNDAFYTNLLAAIDSAKKTIDVATYILNDDAVGQRFYQALIGAAQRGVQVRMVVDGFGSSRWVGLHSKSTIQWMNWRVFHPLKGQWPLNLNRRTHCKLAICDDQKAWVGSQNLTAEHSELASGKAAWRDTGAAVTGADVSLLKLAFEVLWLRSTPQTSRKKWRERLQLLRLKPHSTRHAIRSVRFNASLSLRRRMNLTLAKNIAHAKERVWITNAYFAPTRSVSRALIRAAKRGVDVRLLTPQQSDVFFMPWVTAFHYRPLLRAGARVFEYGPRFLHAKTNLIDHQYWVGSSNMNRRSLIHDLEIDVVLHSRSTLTQAARQFEIDLIDAKPIRLESLNWRTIAGQVLDSLLRPWI